MKKSPHERLSTADLEMIISDPSDHYKTIDALMHDVRLTTVDKIKVLESWAQEETALMNAEDENMPEQGSINRPAFLLQQINKAQDCLLHTIRHHFETTPECR